ncbi:ABC transporter permease [Paeniglutamicibacter antarcticus]|uniref:ABC transporter permease n=1 Tax=Arthrobacter terrae TaxID=2935737 RepID=A0A931CNI9_9MICC|nr:FtsX family ABC transporter permease [Arthrobacter terrae]MBG0739191.1 ABC transporter permease [Arthrobacter terrae]
MLLVALAQLKIHSRRFAAIALAVILAVAFLSATLMVGSSSQASLKASIGQAFAKADLVITAPAGSALDKRAVDAVAKLDIVKASYAGTVDPVTITTGKTTVAGVLQNTSADPALESAVLSSGTLPRATGEVAVDSATAARQGLKPGSTVTLSGIGSAADAGSVGDAGSAGNTVSAGSTGGVTGGSAVLMATVVGITEPSHDPLMSGQTQLVADASTLAALAPAVPPSSDQQTTEQQASDQQPAQSIQNIQLKLTGPANGHAIDTVQQALAAAGVPGARVLTSDGQTTAAVADFTGGSDQLTIILLAFTGIALVVSALVVANTFSVLIAQRTRELALLRCIGAGRSQIRRSVLLEALVVGIVSSALGVVAAVGLMAALIGVLRGNPDYAFATLAVTPAAIIAGLLVGTALTVAAALLPARAATAVAPLAALRPQDVTSVRNRRGVVRMAVGVLLVLAGAAALVYGSANSELLIALPGGAASFIGIMLCAGLFIPAVVAGFGKAASPLGVPGRLAAVNAVRNPGRTTATASALLIGVTLVSMMMTGAATARTAFDGSLNFRYPVDISVSGPALGAGGPSAISAAQVAAASKLPGVQAAALLPVVGTVSLGAGAGTGAGSGAVAGNGAGAGSSAGDGNQPVYGISDADAAAVLRTADNRVGPGEVLLPKGTKLSVAAVTSGPEGKNVQQLPVRTATSRDVPALVSTSTVPVPDSGIVSGAGSGSGTGAVGGTDASASGSALVWLKVDSNLSQQQLLDLRTSLAQTLGVQDFQVEGGALEKATFNQVIDLMLLIVTGLLGVAVVIALIGVANTLSLSVLERTRENSLLRALGLTRGQLRGMLAVEAVLIAGVAALLGSVLGVLYGWLGAQSALGSFAAVTATIPWGQVLLVIAAAAAAGLAASVLPARRAARLSPVEGLAME